MPVYCFPELKGYGMKKIFMQMTLSVFFFLFSTNSFAEIPSKLLQDMFPSKGFIVNVKNDALLIDLDSRKGVKEGDIFTIFSPGETITHPVTKKAVAVLEEKVGVIKVMTVKDGYSTAKRISGTKEIKEGFKIEKFSELKVLYLDYADNPKLYDEFRMTFQNMEWETYEKGLKPKTAPSQITGLKGYDLYVAAEKDKITLYDNQLDRIKEYPFAEAETKIVQKAPHYEETPAEKIVKLKGAAERYKKLFSINKMIRCMDGRKIRGVPYYILATDEEVMLYKYENGQMKNLSVIRDFEGEPVAIFLEDLDNDGSYEIVVNSYNNGTGYTSIYSINGEKVGKVSPSLPFFTALYDTDGDGIRETKLIQLIEGENFWGRIEKVSFRNGVFRKTGEDAPVPPNFHILGGFIADIDGDGSLESGYYSPSGKILIFRGDKHLWTSSGILGGSVISVPYRTGKGEFHQTIYVIINQPLVVMDINGDKISEILMVKSEAGGYNIISSYTNYSGGYVSYLEKGETGFRVNNITEKIDAAVQNMVLMDKEIIFTKVDGSSSAGKGESHLLSFPIK